MTYEKFCTKYYNEILGFFDTGLSDEHLLQTFYEFYTLGRKDGKKQARKTGRSVSWRNKISTKRDKKVKTTIETSRKISPRSTRI